MARVNAVVRSVGILDAVSQSRSGSLTMSELAVHLVVPKSSMHDLCQTLVDVGLLRQTTPKTYSLGLRVLEFGRAYRNQFSMVDDFLSHVRQKSFFIEETSVLAVLDGLEVVYIACHRGVRLLGVDYETGLRLPAVTTATGKALLSTLSDDEVVDRLKGAKFHAFSNRGTMTIDSLLAELREVRRRGYAIDDEETAANMCCIGAAVGGDENGPASAAVAVSLVKQQGTIPRKEEAVQAIMALSKQLSYRVA